MTVPSTVSKVIGVGNGATTVWPFSFKVYAASHLQVVYTDLAGTETILSSSDYTVSLNADQGANPGGTITYTPAIATGTKLTILRSVPYTQEADIKNQGGFFPEVLERAYDLIVMQVQQLREQLARALKLSPSQSAIGELEATDAARAGSYLGFDLAGNLSLYAGLAAQSVSVAMQAVVSAASLAAARTAMGVLGLAENNTVSGNNTLSGTNTFSGTTTFTGPVTLSNRYTGQGDKKEIHGLIQSNAADVDNDMTFSAGGCWDDTGARWIALAAPITKRLDATWAVGTDQGGLQSGSAKANNTNYLYYAILRSDTGVTDVFIVPEGTAVTLPTGYDFKRLIGFNRCVSNLLPFYAHETEGGGLEYNFNAPINAVNDPNAQGQARILRTMTGAPATFSTKVKVTLNASDGSLLWYGKLMCPSETDAAPGITTPGYNFISSTAGQPSVAELYVRTDSSGRIGSRVQFNPTDGGATIDVFHITLHGWIWSRR